MNNMNFLNYASSSAGDDHNYLQGASKRQKGGQHVHEFSEIESLDDSDLLTHRRSKSTPYKERQHSARNDNNDNNYDSRQNISNIHNISNNNSKRILLKKNHDTEEYNNNEDNIGLELSTNKDDHKYDSLSKLGPEIEVPPTEESFASTKDRLYAKYSDDLNTLTNFGSAQTKNINNQNAKNVKNQSTNFEKDSQKLQAMNNKSIINARLSLHDEMMYWKENFLNLQQKHEESRDNYKSWRSNYFRLLEDSLEYEDTVKNLLEENRIHQEYIISLENKVNRILSSCSTITENFHNSLPGIKASVNDTLYQNNPNLVYNQIISDYKKQLEILAEEKESLSTSLLFCRHQQLQGTMKLEAMQNRLLLIERARLDNYTEQQE